ncbi:hypothetical protein Glove_14g23 [Diversispora epigaea]|uniref:Uncharacterized protein n=1 Tax=Diversispora epigaea TaxID=1348612 RepID=A0A397JQ27_9GLOM|nr:hypothetical protein Glove_14g23 [Diversispora epigaea]
MVISVNFILVYFVDLIQKIMRRPIINGPFIIRISDDHEGFKDVGLLNIGLAFNNNYNEWQYYRIINSLTRNGKILEETWGKIQYRNLIIANYYDKIIPNEKSSLQSILKESDNQ